MRRQLVPPAQAEAVFDAALMDAPSGYLLSAPAVAPPCLRRLNKGTGSTQTPSFDKGLNAPHDSLRHLALGAAAELCPRATPAGQEVLFGSDFADVIPLGAGRIALVLGDVSVKGRVSSLYVPRILSGLRLILGGQTQPACVLHLLNRSLYRSGLPAGCPSVALSLLVVDVGTGRTVCACAGSEPPIILRAGGSIEAVNTGRVGLGVDFTQTLPAVDFLLGKGDALLLATDGITGIWRANQDGNKDHLCYEGLVGLALDAFRAGGSPGQVAHRVLDGARSFADGLIQDDASVMVAIRG